MDKRILIISHNVLSFSVNMGKTLSTYFGGFESKYLAQLYIHSEIPTINICNNYYRITDKDMIKSIFTRHSGNIFTEKNIDKNRITPRTDTGREALVYQKARKRTPLIYLARNTWWSLGRWNTKKLKNWIFDFKPDIIFFASGDYSFMYKVALKIAQSCKIPMYVSCMDDYYLYNKNENRIGGKLIHKSFMKQVKKTINYASGIFCICESMSKDYQKLFNKECYTLHTPSSITEPLPQAKKAKISYIGNLSYSRDKQLVDIGVALKSLGTLPKYVDVYSSESRPEILSKLIPENGIQFHGAVSAEKVKNIIAESIVVIHTESFDRSIRKAIKYSVSTKIADSLASGTCLFAYGPTDVASIEYLMENDVACVATSKDELKSKLTAILKFESLRNKYINNAIGLVKKNHDLEINQNKIAEIILNEIKSESITK